MCVYISIACTLVHTLYVCTYIHTYTHNTYIHTERCRWSSSKFFLKNVFAGPYHLNLNSGRLDKITVDQSSVDGLSWVEICVTAHAKMAEIMRHKSSVECVFQRSLFLTTDPAPEYNSMHTYSGHMVMVCQVHTQTEFHVVWFIAKRYIHVHVCDS